MKLEEKDLDRIITNEKIDPNVRMAVLMSHAEEEIEEGLRYFTALIGGLALLGGIAALYYYSHHSQTKEHNLPAAVQQESNYTDSTHKNK